MMTVLTFKVWASVLDGFSSIETFLALTVALFIISLIPISTVYFIQNLSIIPSPKSLDQICLRGWAYQLYKENQYTVIFL